MKKLLTTLTLLFTLCSFAIGQNDYYFGEPIGPDLNMTVASIIYIDGEIQTNQTIEIAAYIDGELRGVCKSFNVYDFAPAPFNEYHYREFIVLGYISDNGKKVTFKGYNHDTQEELIIHNDSDELIYEAQTAILVTAPLKLYFTSANPVAKVGNTEYSNIDDAIANWTANTTLTLLDNVTLSDVITLKSTEHHILDLSTYTMTAASGKNAIEIVAHGTGDAERSAITINADAATPGGINAGSKSVIYYNYTNCGITTNDRPIIKINNGVFYGATSAFGNAGIYFKGGSAARQAATLEITGGVFNCSIIGQSKSKLRISGGIFNYSVGSQGDSTALRLIWGGTFKSFGFMTADDNNTKFWFGTSMANSNVGLYINDDDYLVVGGAVITEAGEMFEASSANYSAWSYLLQYSSVATNGLYYTDALTCLKDNDKTTGSVNVYADQLDLTSLNYKGTINISKNLVVTFTEGTTPAWTVASTDGDVAYNDVTDNGIVTRTYTVITPVAQIGETLYMTLAAAVEAATAGQTITLLKDAEGSGVVINKSLTIDFNGKTYTFTSPAVGSNGTETQGFQILKDNDVVLKNGTLNVAEAAGTDFAMLIQNYANLTVNNMTLNGDNLDRYTIKDYDYSYVLSNNSGEVYINNTIILANPGAEENDGHYGVAFDVCKYASYTAPVVTLDATSTISGIVELSGGELISAQAVTATVKKDIEAYSDENLDQELEAGWYAISFPFTFTNETSHNLVDDKNYDLYRYDEATAYWINHENGASTFGNITLGNGYLYAHAEGKTIEATGKINIAESTQVGLTASYEGSLNGFNLIGNPYTHNITTAHFSGLALATGYYTLSNHGAWQAVEDGVIAPMQGVLVKTTGAGDLIINKALTTKRGESEDNGSIRINVSNENYNDVAYVSFNEGIGLDKIGHRNVNIPMVYVPVDGVNYAIATMSQDVTEIPVSFRAMTMGEYTISAEAQDCEFAMMTLVDRLTGTETNLLIEDYTFVATTKDNADRFCIRLDNSQQTTDNSHFAYINNGMINIDNVEGQGVVSLYDVTGRPVAEFNVSESVNISTSDLTSGMYIIRMSDENGIKVQKIIIE